MRRQFIVGLIIAVAITASVFAFFISSNITEQKTPIRIAINPFPGTDYAFIAQEKGIFEKNGVNVQLVLRPEYSNTVELFANNEVDGAFEVFTDTIIQNAQGIKSKVVYVMDYSTNGDVIISSESSISDLRGKTIGTNGIQSFSHYFVVKILETNGIQEHEVFFEPVSETNILQALSTGKISAGHTWEPTKSKALEKNYKILARAGDVPGTILDVVVFKPEIIKNRPNDVQAIVKSLSEARSFLDTNRAESLDIMSKIQAMTPSQFDKVFDDANRPDLDENKKILNQPDYEFSAYVLGDDVVEFYSKRGVLGELPDLNKIVEPKFINKLGIGT